MKYSFGARGCRSKARISTECSALSVLILVVTMVIRRLRKRVTPGFELV